MKHAVFIRFTKILAEFIDQLALASYFFFRLFHFIFILFHLNNSNSNKIHAHKIVWFKLGIYIQSLPKSQLHS